ncbi:pyridoxamine 5'-phosphate oxidase family protein [Nocardia sp. NPDC056000]|uniref:pyridoxamine 5'-phosphate oxidase family protein n=1 Tax=Nocardia sp. NPDC056000 TaxID=3345674 RepID=UPI0035DE9786
MDLTPLSPTERSTIHRDAQRARTDRAELYAILDEALECHLAVIWDGAPLVLPTTFGRDGDTLYVHGSPHAESLRLGASTPVCVAVTLVDGVVYARALKDFSLNYRSAVIHGQPSEIQDTPTKLHALRTIVEHCAPGSWDYVPEPDPHDVGWTCVLALDLTEASVKVRNGGPMDSAADIAASDVWAGHLPMRTAFDSPIPSPDLRPGIELPDHIRDRRWPGA